MKCIAEVNGVGSIPVWSGGMDFEEIGQNRIEAFEMWCWRKMLSILWQ